MAVGMTAHRKLVVFFEIVGTLLDRDARWVDGAPEALDGLRQAGVPLGIISNVGSMTRAHFQATLPGNFALAAFDPLVILSCEVGFSMPRPQIFEKALERASARHVVFCSADLEHSLAAQRLGIVGLRLHPAEQSDVARVPELLERALLLP
jgi:FMN phosphatase YigB (HAD superfamily)